MELLLIQSPLGLRERKELSFPLGLTYIATSIKNHEITLFDPNIVKQPFYEMEKNIEKIKPDVVGISLRNIDTCSSRDIFSFFPYFVLTVKTIKKIKPDAKIVVGGTGFSIFAKKIMERMPEIDYGIFLEGEQSFPELLEIMNHPERVRGIFIRNGRKVVFTGSRELIDFNELPKPRRDITGIDLERYKEVKYSIGVQTKRGCIFRCSYCVYPYLQGRHVRLRTPSKIVDEIEELVNLYNVENLFFADNIFNSPLNHAREIFKELAARKLEIKWKAYFREDCINKKFFLEAKKAGCQLFEFSPDGASQKALKVLQKDIEVRDIIRTFRLANEIGGINVAYNFMYNVPGEDFTTFSNFFKLMLNIAVYCKQNLRYLNLTNIRIYPNTKIHHIALKDGIIDRETDLITPIFYNPPPLDTPYSIAASTWNTTWKFIHQFIGRFKMLL